LRAGIWERFFIGIYKSDLGRDVKSEVATSLKARLGKLVKNARTADFVGEFDKRLERLADNIGQAHEFIKNLKKSLQSAIDDIGKAQDDNKVFKVVQEKVNEILDSDELKGLLGMRLESLLELYDKIEKKAITAFSKALCKFYHEIKEIRGAFERDTDETQGKGLEEVNRAFRSGCKELLAAIYKVEYKISDYHVQFENKADSWLAQLNAEYKRNMLLWTYMIGLAFVFLFNADAFSIYRYLSANADSRSTIVERAVEKSSISNMARSKDLSDIDRELAKEAPDTQKVKSAVLELAGNLKEDYEGYAAEERVKQMERLTEETGKIEVDAPSAKDELRDVSDELTALYVGLKTTSVEYHLANLATVDLPLGWTNDWEKLGRIYEKKESSANLAVFAIKKITGLLLTAFLITFGAPFWNDILKAIVGLRGGAGKTKEAGIRA